MLNGNAIRDVIVKEGMRINQSIGFFLSNLTNRVIDSTKTEVFIHESHRLVTNGMKATHDFVKGDTICESLCTVAAALELSTAVLVWVPIPGKIPTLTALKCGSVTESIKKRPNILSLWYWTCSYMVTKLDT